MRELHSPLLKSESMSMRNQSLFCREESVRDDEGYLVPRQSMFLLY